MSILTIIVLKVIFYGNNWFQRTSYMFPNKNSHIKLLKNVLSKHANNLGLSKEKQKLLRGHIGRI